MTSSGHVAPDGASTAAVFLPGLAGHPEEFAAQVSHLAPRRRVLPSTPSSTGPVCPASSSGLVCARGTRTTTSPARRGDHGR